jgi:hypothetical protein
MAEEREMRTEIGAHSDVMNSLRTMGRSLGGAESSGNENEGLSGRLGELESNWQSLCNDAAVVR